MTLAVSDQGPGIAPEEQEKVFHRFARLDEGGRAGLGLTIARTFVEAHGESIWYEDAPGGGARFVLSLPVRALRRGRGLMATVLVIDDDPSLLRALRLGLQAGGHEVTTAATGEEGLSLTALNAPDVVVLDLGLPDIDGMSVAGRIRGWSDVPIIVLSATGAEKAKVAALDAGADDYVTKPFSMPELEARIRAVLRGRAAAPEELPASLVDRGPGGRPGAPRGAPRRRQPGADIKGVRRAGVPGAPPGPYLHPPDDPARGLGPGLRRGGPLRPRLRAPPAGETRRRGRRAGRDGPRGRLPLERGRVLAADAGGTYTVAVSPGRLTAFSDGVIAILITIMVLELRQPHGADFSSLRPVATSLFAYLLSFVNLGIYWNNHHHLLQTVRKVTGAMLWSNLNLLFWLSLFPFCTLWMAREHYASQTVATYGVVLVLAALAYTILQGVIINSQRPDTSLKEVLGRDLKAKLSLAAYAVSIPLALAWNWGGVAIFVAVALTWLVPDRRLEHYIDHHAPHEESA